jgi:hypothetical protein
LDSQIGEAAKALGVTATELRAKFQTMGFGPMHDRLRASLLAWVAGLDEKDHKGYGIPPGDVIWVPNMLS